MADAAVQVAPAERETLSTPVPAVREMGFWAVFVFAISSTGLAYNGLLPLSTAAGIWPGVNLIQLLTVALVFSLIHAYTYAVIGAFVPQIGADFRAASRILHAPLAFASSWTLVVFLALSSGMIAGSIAFSALPMFLQIISRITFDKNILDILPVLTTPSGVVTIGTVGIILIFLMLILPPRVTRRVLMVGVILTLVAWGILYYQIRSAPVAMFQVSWDRFMGDGTFLGHLMDARRLGMKMDFGSSPFIAGGLLMGFWMFYGYFNPTHFASEVKKPGRSFLLGGWAALLISWAVLVLGIMFIQNVVPPEWLSAESYLSRLPEFQSQAMPWLPLYAAVINPNPVLVWIVAVIWVFGLFNLAHTLLYTVSRIVLTWAVDRILPEQAKFVHPNLHSPLIAVLMVCIVAEVGLIGITLVGGLGGSFNPVFFMAGTQILPVLAITLLPFRKPDWFNQAAPFVRRKIGRLPLITLAGTFSLLYLAWMMISSLSFSGAGKMDLSTPILFAILFLTGLAGYFARLAYRKSRGELIAERFKVLPEE